MIQWNDDKHVTKKFPALVAQRLWEGSNPYEKFPNELYPADLQGWNSNHPYLAQGLDRARSGVVVEIGVWKGASTIHMALHAKSCGYDMTIVAVDTFLGSSEHWINPDFSALMGREFGRPTLYQQFLSNVIHSDVKELVSPLPLDSANAYAVLLEVGIRPVLVHVDGAHDYDSALLDMRRWWKILEPGGLMIVDDYDPSHECWPEVGRAVDAFSAEVGGPKLQSEHLKARIFKG